MTTASPPKRMLRSANDDSPRHTTRSGRRQNARKLGPEGHHDAGKTTCVHRLAKADVEKVRTDVEKTLAFALRWAGRNPDWCHGGRGCRPDRALKRRKPGPPRPERRIENVLFRSVAVIGAFMVLVAVAATGSPVVEVRSDYLVEWPCGDVDCPQGEAPHPESCECVPVVIIDKAFFAESLESGIWVDRPEWLGEIGSGQVWFDPRFVREQYCSLCYEPGCGDSMCCYSCCIAATWP